MTDNVTYSGRWLGGNYDGLPASSAHDLMKQDRDTRHAAEEAEARRQDALDAAEVKARLEGRDVTLQGVWDRARRSMALTDRAAEKRAMRAKVESGEYEDLSGQLTRSYRDTGYAEDRLVRQVQDNRDWMIGYLVRHDYPRALEQARRGSTYYGQTSRARYASGREITRGAGPLDGIRVF